MPTIMTHAAVPLALWCASERGRISPRLLAAGVVAAMLPDADVAAFALHIPYADAFGHRGASHSLLFAMLTAALGAGAHRLLRADALQAAVFLLICTASHPLLDAMTSGGLGVALAWPWAMRAGLRRGGRFGSPRLPAISSIRVASPCCSPSCAGCGCRSPSRRLGGDASNARHHRITRHD